jgi:hypothetical protein
MKNNAALIMIMALSLVAFLATTNIASGQTIVAGVSKGETFIYSYNLLWNSTNPSATPPSDYIELNKTSQIRFIITNVSGVNLSIDFVKAFKNGTQTTQSGTINLSSGTASIPYGFLIIGANLNKNDRIYPTGGHQVVTDTVIWSYPTGQRETNLLRGSDSSSSTIIYFDKIKGIAVDYTYEIDETSGNYTTVSTERVINTNSNTWAVISESPTPTASPTPSPIPTPLPTSTPTPTPALTPTPTPTRTPTPSPTPTQTPVRTPSLTPTQTSSTTPTIAPTSTSMPSAAPTQTPTNAPTTTPIPTTTTNPTLTPAQTTASPTQPPTPLLSLNPTATPPPTEAPTIAFVGIGIIVAVTTIAAAMLLLRRKRSSY